MRNKKGHIIGKMAFRILFLTGLIVFPALAMADTITIVADKWAPYNAEPKSPEPGYGIEIAKRVFEAAGHKITYEVTPWSRAIKEAREGKHNAIIGAFKEDAPDFVFPEEEFGISESAFFVKKGNTWKYKGLESLLSIKVGLIKDYSYGEELDNFFKANQNLVQYVHGDDPLKKNINKLLAGRFDALLEDTNVLSQKAMKMGVSDQIENAGSSGPGGNVYIAFSPKIEKSKNYAEILSKGIRNLKNSGELEKILAKYGLKYWKQMR